MKLVEPVIVLIHKDQAAGLNPHKFTWYDCSGSAILTVLCASFRRSISCYKCQAWPHYSTQEARWRMKKEVGAEFIAITKCLQHVSFHCFSEVKLFAGIHPHHQDTVYCRAQLRTAWALWGLLHTISWDCLFCKPIAVSISELNHNGSSDFAILIHTLQHQWCQ